MEKSCRNCKSSVGIEKCNTCVVENGNAYGSSWEPQELTECNDCKTLDCNSCLRTTYKHFK